MAVTWSFDHSVIYRSLHLWLVITSDISLVIEITRIDQKVTVIQIGTNSTPTGWGRAPARPAGGGQLAPARPRQRKAGSLTGGPRATVEGGVAGSQMLMHGSRSTVRAVVKFDSKNKFQIQLKSNGSNGFKFLHTLTASKRTFPGSKMLK
jgi:hypothetical protein